MAERAARGKQQELATMSRIEEIIEDLAQENFELVTIRMVRKQLATTFDARSIRNNKPLITAYSREYANMIADRLQFSADS